MAKKKTRAEIEAERARAQANGEWFRGLLERAEANLPPDQRRPVGASNAEWLGSLAERAKADLDARGESSP